MNYEFVLEYFKSFCTKVSNISNFFSDDSTFFFVGDFDKSIVAFGKQQIQERIDELFWNQTGNNVKPIAYNINIEQKQHSISSKRGQTYSDSEIAIVVIGTIKAIDSSDNIRLTKLMGRKFVQTFLLYRNNDEQYCKSTVLAFLAPSDAFNDVINPEIKMQSLKSSFKEEIVKTSDEEDLELKKIAQNIDDMINETDSNVDSDSKSKSKANDLLPISLNELFIDDLINRNTNKVEEKDPFDFETFSYLNSIWSKTWDKDYKNKNVQNIVSDKWIDNLSNILSKGKQTPSHKNSGTSFADKLRNGLQNSWQNLKLDEKSQEIRIIQNCGKSRFKQNNWKNSGKNERRPEFVGQQNITIIGEQCLEQIPETNIIFVANIPIGVSKTDFMALFETFGKVLSMKFVERTGVAFAFVYFQCKTSVQNVLSTTTDNNYFIISGLQLKVDRYKKRISTNVMANQMHNTSK